MEEEAAPPPPHPARESRIRTIAPNIEIFLFVLISCQVSKMVEWFDLKISRRAVKMSGHSAPAASACVVASRVR